LKKRILFVDDEPNLLQGLQRTLRPMRQEWDMAFAENGREALQLLALTPYDVVVTDIFMPEKEGLETIMELRRTFPTTKIVAISGGGRQGNLFNALQVAEKLGAHSTLQKPFNAAQIISAVHEALQV
jgi:YesN/AraC family two-component response regulator